MSESRPAASAQGARYQRSPSGLVGALVVTVLAVLAFVGWRALFRDDAAVPVRAVDYQISLRAGRDAGKLSMLAPEALPAGWRATSASYTPGAEPAWHLGLLTGAKKYVGLEEQRAPLSTLVATYVDENATPGRSVLLDGRRWQSWTDAGGDYALGRSETFRGEIESYVVVGSAPPAQVRALAASLRGARSAG